MFEVYERSLLESAAHATTRKPYATFPTLEEAYSLCEAWGDGLSFIIRDATTGEARDWCRW